MEPMQKEFFRVLEEHDFPIQEVVRYLNVNWQSEFGEMVAWPRNDTIRKFIYLSETNQLEEAEMLWRESEKEGKKLHMSKPLGYCGNAKRWNLFKSIILSEEMTKRTGYQWKAIYKKGDRLSRFEGTPVQNQKVTV